MPELPEVETIRRDLDREIAGRTIDRVVATGRSIRRHSDADEFAQALLGRSIVKIRRRGKYLLVALTGGATLVVHLGMSGQLLVVGTGKPSRQHTHVVVGFGPECELRFVDPRTFGEMFVSFSQNPELPELAHLGIDALDELTSASQLGKLLHARRTKLKALLMDQRFLAGIGNLYVDEILFAARLRFDRSSDTLTPAEVRRLYRALTTTLRAAIDHRGSSLADEQYRDVLGAIGDYQHHHQVYGREGEACPRCRRAIVRVKAAGRSTFLCTRCQS